MHFYIQDGFISRVVLTATRNPLKRTTAGISCISGDLSCVLVEITRFEENGFTIVTRYNVFPNSLAFYEGDS